MKNVLGSILEEKIDKQAKSRARCINTMPRFTRLCKSTVRAIIETMMTAIGTRNPNISLSFWTLVEKIKAYS